MITCDEDDMTSHDMSKMYKEGMSINEIAKEYYMTRQSVWRRLHKRGVQMRTRKEAWRNMYERGHWYEIGGPRTDRSNFE